MKSSTNLSIEDYKKWKINQLFRPYIGEIQKYSELKKNLTCFQAAQAWDKYSDEEQKKRILQGFKEIGRLHKIKESDQIVLDLENLLRNKGKQIRQLANRVPLNNLIDLMRSKKDQITTEDLKTTTYKMETIKIIETKLLESSQYKAWCERCKKIDGTDNRQKMDVQQPRNGVHNQSEQIMQEEIEKNYYQVNFEKIQEGQEKKMSLDVLEKVRSSIRNKIKGLTHRFSQTQILDIQLFKIMEKLLSNFYERVQLLQIQCLLEKHYQFRDCIKRYFEQTRGGAEYTLEGQQGYKLLKKIYMLLLPIDVFQLEERWMLSQFKKAIAKAWFVVGNTGVGKSTFLQCLFGYGQKRHRMSGGETSLQSKIKLKPQHSGLIASSSYESVTTNLSAYTFNEGGESIQLIDTPGFQDSKGALVDISNQITLERAYQVCEDTGFLFLIEIGKFLPERATEVRKFAYSLAQRFEYQTVEQLESFVMIIFNNKNNIVSQMEIRNITHTYIPEISIQQQFLKQEYFKNKIALSFIRKSIQERNNYFDPLNESSINLIKQSIITHQLHGKHRMKSNFSENTKNSIQLTCNLLKKYIKENSARNQITKVRFYYEQIHLLFQRIPHSIVSTKEEVDLILEDKSQKIYDQIFIYLHLKLKNPVYEEKQYARIVSRVGQLESLNELTLVNPKIKSINQIQKMMTDIEFRFIELVNQQVKYSDIPKIIEFISVLWRQFKRYIPKMMGQVEIKCFNKLQELKKNIDMKFKNQQMNSFDLNLKHYEIFQMFYKQFALEHQQVLNRANLFASKDTILEEKLEYVKNISNQITQLALKLIQSFSSRQISSTQLMIAIDSLFLEYIIFEKSQLLCLKDNVVMKKNEITSAVSKQFQRIYQIFNQFLIRFEDSQVSKQNIHNLLSKMDEVNSSTTLEELNNIYKTTRLKVTQKYISTIKQFELKINEINVSLKQNKKLAKDYALLHLKDKIQLTLYFSFLTEVSNVEQMQKGFKLFKDQIERIQNRINEIIEDRELQAIKQSDYFECLNKIALYENYSIVSRQLESKLLMLKDQIIRKIEQYHMSFENALILKKFKNQDQLKMYFNKSLAFQIEQYLNKVYFPSKKVGLLLKEEVKQQLINIYKEISRIFLDVEGIINMNKSIRFPSSMKEQLNHLTGEELTKLFCELESFIEQLCHIYSILYNYFAFNKGLLDYLSQENDFQQDNIEDINLSQLLKGIKQIFEDKVKEIKSYITRSSSLKSNIEVLSCIKKQCVILRRLEIRIKSQNQDMEIERVIILDEIVQSIVKRLNEIENKHFNKIEKVIDNQTNKIKNPFEAGKLYIELKRNSKREVSQNSSENFKEYLESLGNCISNKNREIRRLYRYSQIDSEISNEFLLELEDFIDQQSQFVKIITPQDETLYNIKIIIDLEQIIRFMIEKIQNIIKQYRLQIEKQFQRGKSDEARKKILRMQLFIKVIKRFVPKNKILEQSNVQSQSQNTKYSELINQFKEKLQLQQARGQQFLQNELNVNNIQFLNNTYENFGDHNKFKLKKKIKLFFEELLVKYKQSPLKDYQQRNNDLEDILQKIPHKITQEHKWRNRLQQITRGKKSEEDACIQEIKMMKTDTILERKEILHKFILISNKKARNEVLKKIIEFLFEYVQKISKFDSLVDKLKLLEEQNWIYQQIKSNQIDCLDIINIVKQKQGTTISLLKQIMDQNCKYVSNLIINKQHSVLDRDQAIAEIYLLEKAILRNINKYILKEEFLSIIAVCKAFQSTIISKFSHVCPLNSFHSEKDLRKKIKILVKIYEKFSIYEQIVIQKQKNQIGRSEENAMVVQIQQVMDYQEKETSIQSICRQIQNFKANIDSEIEKEKQLVKNFNFIDDQLVKNLNKGAIEQKIGQLSNCISKLQVFSEMYCELSRNNASINSHIIKNIKGGLNRQLIALMNKIISDFKLTLHNLDEQISKEFNYLQILVGVIENKKLSFLIVEQKSTNSKFTEIEPYQYVKQIVSSKISELGSVLGQDRIKTETFFTNQYIDLKNQIIILQQKQSTDIGYIMDEKQRNEQRIRQQNDGKDEYQMEKLYNEARNTFRSQMQSCKLKYLDLTMKIKEQIQSKGAEVLKKYCQSLIVLKRLQIALQFFIEQQRQCSQTIKNEFKQFAKLKIAKELSKALSKFQNCDQYVHILKNSSPLFQFESIEQFNQKTKAQDINYVMNSLCTKYFQIQFEESSMDVSGIIQKYTRFQGFYNHKTSSFYNKQKTVQNIIDDWSKSDEIQQLATILSVWSIHKSIIDADNQTIFKLEPHPVQIVTLIILLTRQQISKSILSKLAQVKTGEGKSIILATMATFYAKLGYRVNVACYSDYLCQRDFKEFEFLFQAFDVKEHIFYGTFNQICELALRNNKGSLKEVIYKFITGKPQGNSIVNSLRSGYQSIKNNVNGLFRRAQRQNSILLVDEVDVFFQKDYFGQLYRPVVRLNQQEFKDLLRFIWKLAQTKKSIQPEQIYNSQQFKACISAYPRVQKILRNQVYGMLNAVLSERVNNKYEIHERAIKYRDKDKLSSSLHFGFETVFANFREFQAGKISEANKIKEQFIPIVIGEFSYSQLPKHYDIIQGLSGTIGKLPRTKDIVLQEKYSIGLQKVFLMPTIYGTQTQITMTCHLTVDSQFYEKISKKIDTQIQKNRPVLVCFENYTELRLFQQSTSFKSLNLSYSYLHEMQNDQMRDKAINGAGTKRKLTLMTSQFSRGTDIIIRDRSVKKNGGLALIMAYIPKSQSQFQQFKGRTGRQGNNGSIDIFFNKDTFAQCLKQIKNFIIKEIGIPQSQQGVIQKLKDYWNELDAHQMIQKLKQIKLAQEKHKKTWSFIQQIDKNEKQLQFLSYLQTLNTYGIIREKKIFNILIGIDGTSSMRQAFKQLKTMLAQILKRINEMKKQAESQNQFKLQIAVYRNYSSGQRIFQNSTKQKQVQKLLKFLQGLTIDGGQGHEGIQILYKFINVEKDIDMLLLIGDSPPNTVKDIVSNRTHHIWKSYQKQKYFDSQFFDVSSSQDEMMKFNESFVIHGLAIKTCESQNQRTNNKKFEKYLAEITDKYHGTFMTLDFKEKKASEILTKFITTKITSLISGAKDCRAIEEMYQKMYKSYA